MILLVYLSSSREAHPSFLRKQESMLLALIAGLRKNNDLRMSTLNDNPDGFPLPKGTGMTGEQLRASFKRKVQSRKTGPFLHSHRLCVF